MIFERFLLSIVMFSRFSLRPTGQDSTDIPPGDQEINTNGKCPADTEATAMLEYQFPCKSQRLNFFESENVVELSDSLLKFLKENLLNHASEKSIKENSGATSCVCVACKHPCSHKEDLFIKDLISGGNSKVVMNHDQQLLNIQNVVHIFGPFCSLWEAAEEEKIELKFRTSAQHSIY